MRMSQSWLWGRQAAVKKRFDKLWYPRKGSVVLKEMMVKLSV